MILVFRRGPVVLFSSMPHLVRVHSVRRCQIELELSVMADKEPSTSLKQAALFETVGSTPKIDSPTSVPARPWSKRKHIVLGAGIGFCFAFCLLAQSYFGAPLENVQNLRTKIEIGKEIVSEGIEMTVDGLTFSPSIGPKQMTHPISPISPEVIFVKRILTVEPSVKVKGRFRLVIMSIGALYILILGDWPGRYLPASASSSVGGFLVLSLICSCVGGLLGASLPFICSSVGWLLGEGLSTPPRTDSEETA